MKFVKIPEHYFTTEWKCRAPRHISECRIGDIPSAEHLTCGTVVRAEFIKSVFDELQRYDDAGNFPTEVEDGSNNSRDAIGKCSTCGGHWNKHYLHCPVW